jgi:predicted PurR-regulated permease PerM
MKLRVGRVLAIIITLILAFLVIAAFGFLLVSQVSRFGESWPLLVDKLSELLKQSASWISGYFNIDQQSIDEWIEQSKNDLLSSSGAMIGQTLLTAGSVLIISFLIPVYVFMILFYQPILRDFINQIFSLANQNRVKDVVTQIKTVIQRYLVGLVFEAAIVGTLYTITLLILGVDFAIMLGIIGALLNVIPYIGGIVGVALPMVIALATKSSPWIAIYILIIFYIIQLIDNNYIVPKIVASQVKINALFSIVIVIAGNALWGIPGMFLSIPLLAIVKLIFDNIENLKPWGFLLGDTMPPATNIKPFFLKRKRV